MKLETLIKVGYMATLMFCISYPSNVFGPTNPPPTIPSEPSTPTKPPSENKEEAQNQSNQPAAKETKEEEKLLTNLFNNATYENFESQSNNKKEDEEEIVSKQSLEQ